MKILILFLIFFFLVLNCFGQSDGLISDACKEKINRTYLDLIEEYKVVGASIALVKDGKIIFAKGYGFQDREKGTKADENTIYRIGSCSKSFTSVSILQLEEEGKLNINDPVQNYLPQINIESRYDKSNLIPIRSILSHTSGLPSDIINGFFCDQPPGIPWLIEQLNKTTMAAPINYNHAYSNVGYGILGELISERSGKTYKAYVEDKIFKPLNMSSTFVDDGTVNSELISTGYVNKKAIQETQIRDQAAGLIASNVIDMSAYINMLLANGTMNGQQVLSETSVALMEKSHTDNITLPTATDWGFGVYSKSILFATTTDTNAVTLIGHGGDTWAFHADFKYIPEYGIGAIVLTNTDNGVDMVAAEDLIKIYLEEMEQKKYVKYPNQSMKVDSKDMACSEKDIIGEYFLSGVPITVTNVDKIKFKQGVHTLVLRPSSELNTYEPKVHILGIIPFKIKGQLFKFVKVENQVYLKVVQTKSGKESYESVKNNSGQITATWKEKLGDYVLVQEAYECADCPYFNFKGLTMKLTESKGRLMFSLKGEKKGVGGKGNLNVVSDTLSVTPGIGRTTGEALRILENGNLFYSGFEFKRK